MHVLAAIASAVPVRLMKRDLFFVAERLLPMLDERRLIVIGRNRGLRAKGEEPIGKLLIAYAKKADESTLGKLIVETVILLSARGTNDAGDALKAAAQTYKVDNDAILRKVQHEFAMKEKARKTPARAQKQTAKPKKVA